MPAQAGIQGKRGAGFSPARAKTPRRGVASDSQKSEHREEWQQNRLAYSQAAYNSDIELAESCNGSDRPSGDWIPAFAGMTAPSTPTTLPAGWIPAFAGMTPAVVPAEAGTQADARLEITRKLRLFQILNECSTQIPLRRAGQDCHDHLVLMFWSGRNLERRPDSSAAANTGRDAFLLSNQARRG